MEKSIKKLPTEVNKLIIVPDGQLNYIPFEILVTQISDQSSNTYQNLSYLLKKYTIQYLYSTNLHIQKSTSLDEPNSLLAFAPKYITKINSPQREIQKETLVRNSLKDLLFNQSEISELNKYIDGNSFYEEEATEENFKAHAKKSSIIHLAMHSIMDDEKPLQSKLVFSPSLDTIEDGYLHAFEIYKMEVPAKMAVLSACNTANGLLANGEGLISLGRAFSYAGCPSVIMSHWAVDDKATAILMGYFYKHLAKGKTKSLALKDAKLEYLEKGTITNSNPFFWGAFITIGDDAPIIEAQKMSPFIIIVSLFLGLMLVLIVYKKH